MNAINNGGDGGCEFSCEDEPGELLPNTDIAGWGIMLSFVITAYFSVALLVVYYVFYFDPNADPFRSSHDRITQTEYPNTVDCVFCSAFRRARVFGLKRSSAEHRDERLESALDKCIVMFADIQIITGVAILVSGYSSLRCGFSTYHWQLVVDLAWFSSVTHLSTLTFLRHYLHNRPKEKQWRVIAMLVLLVLLCVAIGPTAHFAWLHETDAEKLGLLKVHPSSQAICVYKLGVDTSSPAFESMSVTITLLVYGFAIRIAKLSPRVGNRLRILGARLKKRSIEMRAHWEPNVEGWNANVWKSVVVEPLCIAAFQVLHVQLDLFCSVFAELYWLVISITWGTRRLMATRRLGPAGENDWEFGQVMALVVLAAPLLFVVEHLSRPTPTAIPAESLVIDAGTETATTSQSENENEYERSPAFRGVLFLATWFYLECTAYLFTDAPKEFHQILLALLIEAVLLQPALQLVWSLFCIWLDKHNIRDWVATGLQFLVFLALFKTSVLEFLTSEPRGINILTPAILTSSLAVLYTISLLWSLLELRARARDEVLCDSTTAASASDRRFPQLAVTCLVILISAVAVYVFRFPGYPNEAWVFVALILCFQTTWMGIELMFNRSTVRETWRRVFRSIIFLAMWINLVLWGCYAPDGFRRLVPAHFFAVIVGFSVLSLGWLVTTTVRDLVARPGIVRWLVW